MAILWYSGMKLQRDKIIRGRISEHGNLIAWRHTDRDSCFGCQENRKDAVHVGCAMSCMHGMEVPPWRKCMCISHSATCSGLAVTGPCRWYHLVQGKK
jgi:hypothetical protein